MFQVNPLEDSLETSSFIFCLAERIHLKHQALISSKYNSKKLKCLSAANFVWRFKGKDCVFARNKMQIMKNECAFLSTYM